MPEKSYEEIISEKLPLCPECAVLLEKNNGMVHIHEPGKTISVRPIMWNYSEKDYYHAIVRIDGRNIFLCETDEFDEKSLKRIIPRKRDDVNEWNISLKGKLYRIVCSEDDSYEIINEDGTIVKDEEIEASVFMHMSNI